DGSGSIVSDATKNGQHGTIYGGTWVEREINKVHVAVGDNVISFNGQNQCGQSAYIEPIQSTDLTFEISVYNRGNTNYQGLLMLNISAANIASKDTVGIGFRNGKPNYLNVVVGDGNDFTLMESPAAIPV